MPEETAPRPGGFDLTNVRTRRWLLPTLFILTLVFVYISAPIRDSRDLGHPYVLIPDAFGYYSYLPAVLPPDFR